MWALAPVLVLAAQLPTWAAAQCADVQDGCAGFISSGQYSCSESFCSSCLMAANQCDLTCDFCPVQEVALPEHEMAAVTEVASDGVAGFTTYRLHANLPATAANVYVLAGTADSPLTMPAAYQCATPFGTHLGGVSPVMFAVASTDDLGYAEYDSWLTIGPEDGSYAFSSSPGVSDNLAAWSEDQPLEISDGAIFWMPDNMDDAPGPGPATVLLGQLTVVTGSGFTARAKLQGRSSTAGAEDWSEDNVHWFVASASAQCSDSPGSGTTCAIYFSFGMNCATDFCADCPHAGFCDNSCDFCAEAAAAAATAQAQLDTNTASIGSHRNEEAAAIESSEFECATSMITNSSMTVSEYQALHHDCDNNHDVGQDAANTCAALVGGGHHNCRTDFCPCCIMADYCNGLCGFCHPEPVPEPEPEAEVFPEWEGSASIGLGCDRNQHGLFIYDCNGMCAAEMWLGDGQCDDAATGVVGNLACEELQYDEGDCVHLSDEAQYVLDCSGLSAPVLLRGDGTCDNGLYTHVDPNTGENVVVDFNCDEHFSDGGDCTGAGLSQLDCAQALTDFTDSCDHEGADGMRCNDDTCRSAIERIESVYDECSVVSGMSDELLPQIESICGACSPKPPLDFCGIVGRMPSASEDCPDDCSQIISLWMEDNYRTCHEGEGFTGFPDSALPGLHAFYRKCRAIYSDTLPWPEAGECRADEVRSCDGESCVVANWKGDQFCDGALHCSDHDFDGGDCLDLSIDLGSVCNGQPRLGCLAIESEPACRDVAECTWQNAVQVEGAVYIGITLAIDISEVPSVAGTKRKQLLLPLFNTKSDHFTKPGSGQT
jgi:hypothetical protein